MTMAFDYIQRDKRLQEHWLRRLVAFIIDAIIVAIIVWILTFFIIIRGFAWFFGWSFISGVFLLLYSSILEALRGATLGKELLKLRAMNRQGNMDIGKALMRNISKIFWLILLLDVLIAFFTEGEPKQRFMDRIANTTVDDVSPHPQTYRQYQPSHY